MAEEIRKQGWWGKRIWYTALEEEHFYPSGWLLGLIGLGIWLVVLGVGVLAKWACECGGR